MNRKWQFIVRTGRLPAKELNRSTRITAQLHATGIKEVTLDQRCTTSLDNYGLLYYGTTPLNTERFLCTTSLFPRFCLIQFGSVP